MKKIFYPLVIATFLLLLGCNTNQGSGGHSHDVVGGLTGDDEHAHEAGALSYTLFSDNYELFVEFPALVVGQTSAFAAHFTRLSDYKPVSQGKLTVSIVKNGKGLRHSVEAPASPGIFRPALQAKESGNYLMLFELESERGTIRFEISEVQVFANADEAAHATGQETSGDEITYLKEQAWKTEFATQEIHPQAFYAVIHTSGKVKIQPQSEITLNAQAAGTIHLLTVLGESVKKGDLLAFITATGVENNMTLKMNESKIAFEKSQADYIRSKPLADKQVVSQKDFLDIQARYQQDSLRYKQLANFVSQKGFKIMAPFDGFVSSLEVSNGQFIEPGTSVLQVSNKNRILIETFVNQSDFQRVDDIFDANFKFTDDVNTISLKEINGKVTAKNAFVNEGQTRIPVTFSGVNNGSLMPGMFLEAYLKTGKKENAMVVPLSAVIEEQGQYYVFVQTGGESFVKRQLALANNDGMRTEIKSGLEPGERIVSQGAYQIKLAAMAGDLPIHGHTH